METVVATSDSVDAVVVVDGGRGHGSGDIAEAVFNGDDVEDDDEGEEEEDEKEEDLEEENETSVETRRLKTTPPKAIWMGRGGG